MSKENKITARLNFYPIILMEDALINVDVDYSWDGEPDNGSWNYWIDIDIVKLDPEKNKHLTPGTTVWDVVSLIVNDITETDYWDYGHDIKEQILENDRKAN